MTAMPQDILFLLRQLVIRLEDGETVAFSPSDKLRLPLAEFLAAPTLHTTLIHALAAVRDDQVRVYALHTAPPFTGRAGSHG